MIYKILIENTRTGGLVQITSTGADEKEAVGNILVHYPKATKADFIVKAIMTAESFNRLKILGLIA